MKRLTLIILILTASIVAVFAVFVKLEWGGFSDRFATETMIDFRDFLPENLSEREHESTQTSTTAAPFSGWKFAVIGDTEDGGPVMEAFLKEMREREDIEFIVHTGDVSSHGDRELMLEVKNAFATLPIPTYYVPGNNDLIYDEATERRVPRVYQQVFGQELYSKASVKNADLFLLDNSYRRIGFADEELAWLKKELQTSKADYRFLFFHRPVKVPGEAIVGDDETTASRAQNEKFLALLASHHVDHIFTGHIHTSLVYSLGGVPVTITGGGGAAPQAILGGEAAAYYHYIVVTVPEDGGEIPHVQVVRLQSDTTDPTNQSR